MCTKGFKVVIELDIHAVTCPGVWLCPNGKVCLKINILGFSSKTKFLPPVFPLLVHEQFVFEKLMTACRQLVDLQKYFEEQVVLMKLIQKSGSYRCEEVILAEFEIALIDLLYPSTSRRGVLTGVDIDLLMEPSCHFPGIIAPKVELSTKTAVEEVNINTAKTKKGFINPKTLRSKTTQKELEPCVKSKLAQQGHCNVFYHGHRTCHCCLKVNGHPPFVAGKKNECGISRSSDNKTIPQLPTLPCHRWGGRKLICRHFTDEEWHKRQVSKEREKYPSSRTVCHLQRPVSSGDLKNDNCVCIISHRSGNCAVCNLYKKYFPQNDMEENDSPESVSPSDEVLNCKPMSMDEQSCSDDSSVALPCKKWEQSQPEKTREHFTDYTSSSRLTSELSRRVRRATNRVDYPFLQTDKGLCRCCAHDAL